MTAPPTSSSLAIAVRGISKAYRIWKSPSSRILARILEGISIRLPEKSTLSQRLGRQARGMYRDFQALRDVSFELPRGEALGIVGRNGSGKSTLLQIVAGTLRASSGEVSSHGRVAALLELGSGFNPEFTGRENVHLNAAVLGLSRAQTEARFDDIAAFADIGDFMDQPVKFLSSGMVMRLAFAVAIHVDPEVLIVDEALSVGDARFQLKCARAIDAVLERGVSILFVSHDLSMVKRMCHSALLLEGGRMLYHGRPNDVTNLYSKLLADGGSVKALADDIARLRGQTDDGMDPRDKPRGIGRSASVRTASAADDTAQSRVAAESLYTEVGPPEDSSRSEPESLGSMENKDRGAMSDKIRSILANEHQPAPLSGDEYSYGGELGQIESIVVLDGQGQERTWFDTGEVATIRMQVEAFQALEEPIFALTLKNTAGVEIYGTNTLFSRQPAAPMAPGARAEIDFTLPLNVMRGTYFLSLGFTHFVGERLVVVHRRYDVVKLEVHAVDWTFGIANLWARIAIRSLPAKEPTQS